PTFQQCNWLGKSFNVEGLLTLGPGSYQKILTPGSARRQVWRVEMSTVWLSFVALTTALVQLMLGWDRESAST
ncbi:MAG: hypothetical protein ACYCU8_14565, partial [Ferrimicrobium acidiphilum]